MKKGRKTLLGKSREAWQQDLLKLDKHTQKEISLTEMQELTGLDRGVLSRGISRLARGRREAMYETKAVLSAIKEKLEEGNI